MNRCYMYKRLCFGLASAPSTWLRLINMVLSGIDMVYAYMDDIIIYSRTRWEHIQKLEEVFKRFSYHGLELSVKKCQFFKKEVEYLGFTFTPHGIKTQPKLLTPMLNAKLPKTVTEARALVSLLS